MDVPVKLRAGWSVLLVDRRGHKRYRAAEKDQPGTVWTVTFTCCNQRAKIILRRLFEGLRTYMHYPDDWANTPTLPNLPGCGDCWCCYNYEISMPARCDAEDDPIMLWGRQTRPSFENNTGMLPARTTACAKTNQSATRTSVWRTEQRATTDGTGSTSTAPAPQSRPTKATFQVDATSITVECVIETEGGDIGVDKHYPNRYNDVVHNGHDFFDDMLVNRYGQIVPDADFDESTLPKRAFDTRAKAQACMLCSLYTARHPSKVAYIKENEFAKCTMYDYDSCEPAEDEEKLRRTFGITSLSPGRLQGGRDARPSRRKAGLPPQRHGADQRVKGLGAVRLDAPAIQRRRGHIPQFAAPKALDAAVWRPVRVV